MTLTTHGSIDVQALQLTERVMRSGRPIAQEQPLAFDPKFSGRRWTIEEDGAVLSSLVTLERTLVIGDQRVAIGLIGSVVTDPASRGRGYATQLLNQAEDYLRSKGAVLSLLWADEREFYSARGYSPIGTELDYSVPKAFAAHLPSTDRVRLAVPEDYAAVHRLYSTLPERSERTLDETVALLSGPDVNTLIHVGDNGIDGYAIEGRGEDLRGVVHEWAGDAEACLTCLGAHLTRLPADQDSLWWMVPPSATSMQSLLNEAGIEGVLGVLGMGKLLNFRGAATWINAVTPDSVRVENEQAGVRLHGPGGEILLGSEHCLFAIVPPQANRELVEVVETCVGTELPSLPQNAFLWGLDSI